MSHHQSTFFTRPPPSVIVALFFCSLIASGTASFVSNETWLGWVWCNNRRLANRFRGPKLKYPMVTAAVDVERILRDATMVNRSIPPNLVESRGGTNMQLAFPDLTHCNQVLILRSPAPLRSTKCHYRAKRPSLFEKPSQCLWRIYAGCGCNRIDWSAGAGGPIFADYGCRLLRAAAAQHPTDQSKR